MALMLWMISDSVMSVCKITEQELDEDLVVVPQLCLESSYCPWWALTDGDGWLCTASYPLGYISPLFSSVFLILHSRVYWKLFTVQGLRGDTATSIAGPALGRASPCRPVPSTNETEHAGDSCYNWSKQCGETCWCQVREAWWVVQETWTQWEVL